MSIVNNPMDALRVIDRLVVGPVTLTSNRLTAPYTVHAGRSTATFNLIYKYEEPVFDPADPDAANLASVIAAQVALNYGLFCGEIAFKGPFDGHDRRFIDAMAQNTAREIFVNKLLMPNPFLLAPARDLPPVKAERYLGAALTFDSPAAKKARVTEKGWSTDRARHAILSSGGKDSLLTHALLDEAGFETHPIYLNESGRHWYTALNAYRHFVDHVPRTARVWTNSDRLFTWMLRHLPFIRPDFASLRSDDYPLRLWTVAVFLFGALPILRKRGIGRLLIGDEYDTTIHPRYKGIPHYGGLFDQSRHFDEALSKYFAQKGWGISQFSILRPLSELLIEKTLVERYPEIQRHQVSCHATHIEGDRIHPCGRCEKCRRIVGMMLAFGKDPTRCGYTKRQIEAVTKALPNRRLHQESAGAEHLIHLLGERGIIDPSSKMKMKCRVHPEVAHLRFDKACAPIDLMPNDLRAPLYKMLLAHAEGALVRQGKQWTDFNPLSEASLTPPYRFES